MTASLSFSADLRPRELANEHHFLVDLPLRRPVAEHTPQVLDFGRDQLVVLQEEEDRCGLEIAFRDSDELRGLGGVLAHTFPNDDCRQSNPMDEPFTVYVCWSSHGVGSTSGTRAPPGRAPEDARRSCRGRTSSRRRGPLSSGRNGDRARASQLFIAILMPVTANP